MNAVEPHIFQPEKLSQYKNSESILCIDGNYIYYDPDKLRKDIKRCLLVARGNAGNIDGSNKLIQIIRKFYNYDIYIIEYPGFGAMPGNPTIKGCIETVLYWLEKLKTKYDTIDCFGLSLGGGIITECLFQSKIAINQLYLMSSFTRFLDAVKTVNIIGYGILKTFINESNILRTIDHLKDINIEELIILHSKNDSVIPYNHANELYERALNDNINVMFIELKGDHNNPML